MSRTRGKSQTPNQLYIFSKSGVFNFSSLWNSLLFGIIKLLLFTILTIYAYITWTLIFYTDFTFYSASANRYVYIICIIIIINSIYAAHICSKEALLLFVFLFLHYYIHLVRENYTSTSVEVWIVFSTSVNNDIVYTRNHLFIQCSILYLLWKRRVITMLLYILC